MKAFNAIKWFLYCIIGLLIFGTLTDLTTDRLTYDRYLQLTLLVLLEVIAFAIVRYLWLKGDLLAKEVDKN